MEQLHFSSSGLGVHQNWSFRTALGARLSSQRTHIAIDCSWKSQCREIPRKAEAPTALATKKYLNKRPPCLYKDTFLTTQNWKFLPHNYPPNKRIYVIPEWWGGGSHITEHIQCLLSCEARVLSGKDTESVWTSINVLIGMPLKHGPKMFNPDSVPGWRKWWKVVRLKGDGVVRWAKVISRILTQSS